MNALGDISILAKYILEQGTGPNSLHTCAHHYITLYSTCQSRLDLRQSYTQILYSEMHPLLLQSVFPLGVGGAALFNSAQTKRSYKFLGRWKATKGGYGMACVSLSGPRCEGFGGAFLRAL